MWIRADHAFPAIVDVMTFAKVQEAILARAKRYSDDEMLQALKELWSRHGRISGLLIDEQDSMASSAAFRHRFGSLIRAYQLVGYTPRTDYSFFRNQPLSARAASRGGAGSHHAAVHHGRRRGARSRDATAHPRSRVVCVFSPVALPADGDGSSRWMLRFEESFRPDLTIAVRMNETNDAIKDYYLFPAIDLMDAKLRLAENNHSLLDAYRFDDLEFFLRHGRAHLSGGRRVKPADRIAGAPDSR